MANPIFWRLQLLLAKLETTYGVDPTLTGANNAILATDVSLRPMEGEDVPRNLIQAYLGGQATIPAGLRTVIEFSTELAGSGEAGTPPGWGPLLRACAMAEVIDADTSVTYTPISEAMESLYIKFWIGATLHAIKGARGTGVFTINAQGIPSIRWTFTGLWVEPAEVARPTGTTTGFQKPQIASTANTPVFTVNAVPLVGRSFSLNFGNQVEPRLLLGRDQIVIPDRVEALDLVCEATPVTTFNPYALANDQTRVPAIITHGTVAGSIITLTAPTCQVKRPTGYQQNQGVTEWTLNLSPLPTDAGNDQFSIVLT
ncbi:hypothetical protein X566_01530 [Afipia sp. P52-10]|uniref:phage tail tube protein n=1 Tax=Afipia sp. P52-10 TaxID=1429916 RepID=UPI0003DF41E3|nr:phage tail tube protein [Afipia sp. P52-10]ETR79292.1 hypothetical protein X566_01530 [Afipia sp. P52-10]